MTNPKKKPTYEQLEAECERLRGAVERLTRRIEELERSGKRQASPFGRDPDKLKKKPKKPGRKSGKGKWCRAKEPDHVDETVEATLPATSPCCQAPISETRIADQYQIDTPRPQPHVRKFRVHIGCCAKCGKRIQGRHSLQTSDALGAAAVQLGPTVIALAAMLNKENGMSWGRVARFIASAFGIKATPATYCRAVVERLAKRAEPVYEQLMDEVTDSEVITADETGWRIAAQSAWLWILTTVETTIYAIERSRGWEVPANIIGPDWSGTLVRDGYAPYRSFEEATHQTCLAHLLRRAHGILKIAEKGERRFAKGVIRILKSALQLRDKRSGYSEHGFAVRTGQIAAEFDRLLSWKPTYEPNRIFVKHLLRERDAMFTFLKNPEVPATNWRAERGIRTGVVNRKMSGGNRSDRGAKSQAVLMSVLRTCRQRSEDALKIFIDLLRGMPINMALSA